MKAPRTTGFYFLAATVLFTGWTATAEPLEFIAKEKRTFFFQLVGGYTEGFLCKKEVNLGVAEKFFQQKFAGENFSPEQVAQIAHVAIGIHAVQVGEFFKQRPNEQAIAAHCKTAYGELFGPGGRVIPGLLK